MLLHYLNVIPDNLTIDHLIWRFVSIYVEMIQVRDNYVWLYHKYTSPIFFQVIQAEKLILLS